MKKIAFLSALLLSVSLGSSLADSVQVSASSSGSSASGSISASSQGGSSSVSVSATSSSGASGNFASVTTTSSSNGVTVTQSFEDFSALVASIKATIPTRSGRNR